MTAQTCAEAASALPAEPTAWALAIVGGGQLIEYVFPPAPGEITTVLGVFLSISGGWPLGGVFAVALIGSVVGGAVAWWFGGRFQGATPKRLAPLVKGFQRHGAAYLIVNRFLPGIRPLFFVAAGIAGMPGRKVLMYAAISAALWNAGLVAAGWAAAGAWLTMCGWFLTYSWVVLAVVVAGFTLLLAQLLR